MVDAPPPSEASIQLAIVLPWPPASLSGHAKGSWRSKSRPTAEYRQLARMIARPIVRDWLAPQDGDIPVTIIFHAPNNRGDRTNYPNRLKPYFDGLADALGVNDRRFLPNYVFGENRSGGEVIIEIGLRCCGAPFVERARL